MTDLYIHKGLRVEVVAKSEDVWFFRPENGGQGQQGLPQDFTPVHQAEIKQFPAKQKPSTRTLEKESGSPTDATKASTINLNTLDKEGLANHLLGIGKIYSTRILSRKPVGGYESWDQLIEINGDFSLNWEMIRQDNPLIVFS